MYTCLTEASSPGLLLPSACAEFIALSRLGPLAITAVQAPRHPCTFELQLLDAAEFLADSSEMLALFPIEISISPKDFFGLF